MKTNYQMLRDLNFKPESFGWLNKEEVEMIRNNLCIKERTDIELQNLRDFVVLYYSSKDRNDLEMADLMSAITGVIDAEKINRGMEI